MRTRSRTGEDRPRRWESGLEGSPSKSKHRTQTVWVRMRDLGPVVVEVAPAGPETGRSACPGTSTSSADLVRQNRPSSRARWQPKCRAAAGTSARPAAEGLRIKLGPERTRRARYGAHCAVATAIAFGWLTASPRRASAARVPSSVRKVATPGRGQRPSSPRRPAVTGQDGQHRGRAVDNGLTQPKGSAMCDDQKWAKRRGPPRGPGSAWADPADNHLEDGGLANTTAGVALLASEHQAVQAAWISARAPGDRRMPTLRSSTIAVEQRPGQRRVVQVTS